MLKKSRPKHPEYRKWSTCFDIVKFDNICIRFMGVKLKLTVFVKNALVGIQNSFWPPPFRHHAVQGEFVPLLVRQEVNSHCSAISPLFSD